MRFFRRQLIYVQVHQDHFIARVVGGDPKETFTSYRLDPIEGAGAHHAREQKMTTLSYALTEQVSRTRCARLTGPR